MMGGNIIRKERLDIYRHPTAGFEDPFTFCPDHQKFFEILIPFMGIVMRILRIGMPEVVGRGGDDEIDTSDRECGKAPRWHPRI